MLGRTSFLIFMMAISASIFDSKTLAQDINRLKAGVVRIENGKTKDVGTGFIVKLDGKNVYIVTAAHVVKGMRNPNVYLFSQQHEALSATVLDREEDDIKGLALLLLKTSEQLLSKLTVLKMGYTAQLGGGEDIKVIGFPDGTAFWTVGSGSIARIEGRNLVFSGAIRGGNSGGPVIFNGLVIGLITDVSQSSAYAARGEVIEPYVNGIVPNPISISKPVDNRSGNEASSDEFCQTLNEALTASEGGFYSIVGKQTESENTFYPKLLISGATNGYVTPPNRVYYYLLTDKDKGKVESLFYTFVTKVRGCLPKWEEKEDSDSSYRYHKFRNKKGGVVVSVYYNPTAQNGNYYLTLDLSVPDSRRSEW